ncbi:uncharacterized protein Tco025E_09766 [Trypanosoma conorhini]|uniref:Uncharacterized protein n=1 Tax=Trypanosoma conorhini TaxID=83891 RepID=A0A422MSY3_9TRYP|nr:uncharacterized protein Tco025E_09766 [Trypanosoma conorhini]RNE96303.1 hypothetical protein Tco025E_09766 [Trypanosoma conorhini]
MRGEVCVCLCSAGGCAALRGGERGRWCKLAPTHALHVSPLLLSLLWSCALALLDGGPPPSFTAVAMIGRTVAWASQQKPGRVRRLDGASVRRLFPPSQIAQWPQGYLPACGVAHFLHPDGVPLRDVIDCYQDMKADQRHELQRDFAADYTLWCRGALSDFVRRLGDRGRRRLRRYTARDRVMHDAEVRELFGLCPYAPPDAATGRRYEFTPYATTQTYAMLPVSRCEGPGARLHFTAFPQIRNVMHTEFDSMGPSRALSLLSGDDLMPTAEMVQTLAFYLRRRVEEITTGEAAFRRSANKSHNSHTSGASDGSDDSEAHAFSRGTPVACFFGNGRLPWLLNNSEILPFRVLSLQPPSYAVRRERQQKHLLAHNGILADLTERGVVSKSFSTVFPCESISVQAALRRYRPCIALVEPHVDRDWLCDLRGFYSVREVVLLGPVDSPAMGSFAFPFLSFGVTPGPTTYWTYGDTLQRVAAANRIQMPMDPPYALQGYTRHALDDVSSYLLSPNDCTAFGCQYRSLSFLRSVFPVVGRRPATSPTAPATLQHG